MSIENLSPVTVSTEQATVHATAMESVNNGMKPQGSATPDSNCSANAKDIQSVPVEENTSGTVQSGTPLQNPYIKKWDGTPLQPDIVYHRNDMIDCMIGCIKENRSGADRAVGWVKTCREKTMVQPAKVVPASTAKLAGLTPSIQDPETKEYHDIPDELIDTSLVALDGTGRLAAHNLDVKKAMEDPNYEPFDYKFWYEDIKDPKRLLTQFFSVNFDTKKTTNAELTGYAAVVYKNPYTEYYHEMLKDGYVAKAAAYYTFGKEPTREDMKKINEGKTVSVNDEQVTAMRNALNVYKNVFVGNASAKLLHGVPLAKWTHNKVKDADNKTAFVTQITQKFNSLDAKQIAKMQDAKGVKNDKTQTTEIVLRELFDEIFDN